MHLTIPCKKKWGGEEHNIKIWGRVLVKSQWTKSCEYSKTRSIEIQYTPSLFLSRPKIQKRISL